MSSNDRAILRDSHGKHLQELTVEEQDAQEWLASRGEVIKTTIIKKGRQRTIYTQKAPKQAPIVPSDSPNSECSLSENDSQSIARLFAPPNRRQIERWLGWGLIGA